MGRQVPPAGAEAQSLRLRLQVVQATGGVGRVVRSAGAVPEVRGE